MAVDLDRAIAVRVVDPDGATVEVLPLPCAEAILRALLAFLFREHWDDIVFGPIIEGAAFEWRPDGPPTTMGTTDGYLTFQFGRSHFHLCIGPHKGTAHSPVPPALALRRQVARTELFRRLERKSLTPISWGLRMFNGAGEQQITIFFPNPFLSEDLRKVLKRPDWSKLALWDLVRARWLGTAGPDPFDRSGKGFRHGWPPSNPVQPRPTLTIRRTPMMKASRTSGRRPQAAPWRHALWIALLAAASVVFSMAFACAMPFAALGTLAALHMSRRDALAVTGIAWLANQLVGYGLLDYPWTANSLAWGAALCVAALLATLAAGAAGRWLRATGRTLTTTAAFVAAFATYESALAAAAVVLSDDFGAFAPLIVGQILVVNAAALTGLLALNRIAVATGLAETPAPQRVAIAAG